MTTNNLQNITDPFEELLKEIDQQLCIDGRRGNIHRLMASLEVKNVINHIRSEYPREEWESTYRQWMDAKLAEMQIMELSGKL